MPELPVVVAARRTPIATRGRALRALPVEQLGAAVLRALVDDAAEAPIGTVPVGDVVLGNCMGPGGNPARVCSLAAGLDPLVPGMTVDRQCGSGLAAIVTAADAIRSGDRRLRLAGGVESASTAPERQLDGVVYSRAPFVPAGWHDPDMPQAADDLAGERGISRERQDAYALRSHERAAVALQRATFAAELVPVGGVSADEVSPVTAEMLRRFTPLFPSRRPNPAAGRHSDDRSVGGTVTAGNSCRVSDGAAAVMVAPGDSVDGLPGLALRANAIIGCDPKLPGLGAAYAVTAALERAGCTLADVAAFEIVEAFAAQALAVNRELGLADTDERICTDGGALALGHPWAASSAVSVVRLFSRLVRGDAPAGTIGVAAASIGGGMGISAVFEVRR